MRFFLTIILILLTCSSFAQKDSLQIDEKYLEDQLYFGITYNSFANTPEGFLENSFSYGISLGFVKDIPFNKRRNFGMGLGLGYSYNIFNQNLAIEGSNEIYNFSFPENLSKNQYTLKSIELPIELRWRSSTLEKYRFWRVYGGLTLSYILSFKDESVVNGKTSVVRDIPNLNQLQYGVSLAVGYGKWNLYANYSLTPLFKKETLLKDTSTPIEIQILRLGVLFYMF